MTDRAFFHLLAVVGALGNGSSTERKVMKWQPIETAPRDERTILVFNEGFVVTVAWRYDERWGGVWGSENYIQDGSIYDDALIAYSPTHWMPLPDPPTEASDDQT